MHCLAQLPGLSVCPDHHVYHTTNSNGVVRFPNLLMEMDELTGVNQVWISDITYYPREDHLILHSDGGGQYYSKEFLAFVVVRLTIKGVRSGTDEILGEAIELLWCFGAF